MSFQVAKRDRAQFLAYLRDLEDAIDDDEPGPFLTFKEFKREQLRTERLRRRDPGGDIDIGG